MKSGALEKGYVLSTSLLPLHSSEELKQDEIATYKLEQISTQQMREVLMRRLHGNELMVLRVIEMCKNTPRILAHLIKHID